jgi:hypothetical protein
MSDLLSIKVPSLEAIETMEREDMIEKFLVLLDHFYRAVEEIRTLRVHLREAQVRGRQGQEAQDPILRLLNLQLQRQRCSRLKRF